MVIIIILITVHCVNVGSSFNRKKESKHYKQVNLELSSLWSTIPIPSQRILIFNTREHNDYGDAVDDDNDEGDDDDDNGTGM